ncbi:MAG TPA: NUDIX hydrolase, partial [Phytomonospora sp.]
MGDTLAFTAGLPTKRVAAGVLFHGPDGRILLVEPTYKDYWDLPGGLVERNESPASTAAREVKEELGLVVRVGNLLVVDWFAPVPGAVTEALMFVFDGGYLSRAHTDQIRLQGDELRSWAWSTPAETATRMT